MFQNMKSGSELLFGIKDSSNASNPMGPWKMNKLAMEILLIQQKLTTWSWFSRFYNLIWKYERYQFNQFEAHFCKTVKVPSYRCSICNKKGYMGTNNTAKDVLKTMNICNLINVNRFDWLIYQGDHAAKIL